MIKEKRTLFSVALLHPSNREPSMPLTLEQRREINLRNSEKSTGPKTKEGKAQARQNALKHGLRAKVLALPNEDPLKIAERSAFWNDYYNPKSPAAHHLVNECVQATILSDRVHTYHHFALSRQIRGAKNVWLTARENEVQNLNFLMSEDPGEAVRLLKRSGHGLRSLIARWEILRKRFAADGCLNGSECDQAIGLLGCRSTLEDMKEHPAAYMLCLFNGLANPASSEDGLDALRNPRNVPPSLRGKIVGAPDRSPEECRNWIKALFARELTALHQSAEALEEDEQRDFDEAEDRALILHDETEARLFLRYQAESRTGFHRAFNALEKTLKGEANGESCFEEETPNEADSRAFEEIEPEIASPNEADLLAFDEIAPELPKIEVEVEAGLLGKLKPVVIGLLLLLLMFSARIALAASPNEAIEARWESQFSARSLWGSRESNSCPDGVVNKISNLGSLDRKSNRGCNEYAMTRDQPGAKIERRRGNRGGPIVFPSDFVFANREPSVSLVRRRVLISSPFPSYR